MKIVVIGTGYVGLVTGTCFAESGNDVTCVDINAGKIERLNQGEIPIYEPGLTELVKRNAAAGRLKFTTDVAECTPEARCVFLAVGTPMGEDGSADLTGIWSACDSVAAHLEENAIVICKSTVPVGTNRKVYERLKETLNREVHVASNPEFLKEGCAIDDFTKPDRVVVGVMTTEAAEVLEELYKPFLRTEHPFLVMGLESAEMTKYVANCMLATKISFINEMANLCEVVGADVNEVRKGIGHDQRIGFQFLFPGVGYGGSCFPKDVRALMATASEHQVSSQLLQSVDNVNKSQKSVLFEKIKRFFGSDLKGKTIAIWGLAFKPRTDDIREAPALTLIDQLLEAGASIRAHDPVAMENVKSVYDDKITYCKHQYETVEGADVLAICTEWNEYRTPDFNFMKQQLKSQAIFDGRNLYDPQKMFARGFFYSGIGLKQPKSTEV
ncbi:UDP-glucose/GDP-mannose dehydrogenase family protein [Rubinisphaera sp.]|uniref:UDP-glucose dehydrogenase family protein n=1 Tax=Rubinisphaera sp. TaxID=2024857 RepID=UPI000C0C6E15|nr:UDP-glucose/GDP-mannose dehydrogenase family protein [Rubinisphaera sp.]MBV12092.1 UDP-glucose 6-dehydrogenase [Rubinisphaera sp.]HCS55407.1 UDP-glucose 6-dehydrogenase [Planctomycetaceae bacterium]|tara:strand:+ start:38819 stop:40141 length:1323 start_codon:yes stop_codon:yes gene_type:complete